MKIQEYIDYIEQPINLMLHNKPTMVVISGAMSVFYALTHFIGDSRGIPVKHVIFAQTGIQFPDYF